MGKTIQIFGFPCNARPEEVTTFLEHYTGKGTVFRLKMKESKRNGPNRISFATVQFTTTESAELMFGVIQRRLNYRLLQLRAWKMERDMVPRPRTPMLTLDAVSLQFGCQTSDNSFHVFEKVSDVVVNFGFCLRKVEFLLTYCNVEYKLELSYDSIWQIHLRNPPRHNTKFLVIQLLAAPRIYEKLSSGSLREDLLFNYYKDTQDDQWFRRTDFMASMCVGQSSSLCLEIHQSSDLHCIQSFHYYKEKSSAFIADYGATFSRNSVHGPVVESPLGLELPYAILFKVNSLVQNGCLVGTNLDDEFFRLVHPRNFPISLIECALEKMYHIKDCCYEPVRWLNEQYVPFSTPQRSRRGASISLDDGLVYIRRVQVTPTKVYFCGPEVNVSNRVLRKFHEHIENFIRVSFVDEDGEKLRSTDLHTRSGTNEGKRYTALYERVLSTLSNGMTIGCKRFEFLAFSSSQLRENSLWMFASRDGVTASSIREWMGDFRHIKNVAKYAARLGQSFGSSKEALTVARHEFECIPDVETVQNGSKYVFSDGIGKISSDFAVRVAQKCGIVGPTPSAFQIRYAGYKGVVAVDPTSVMKLSLRGSMSKYTSSNTKLDVLTWSKFQPCFLNRQIITLLSTLGVGDHIFEKKQKETVDQLDMMLTSPSAAYEVLEVMAPTDNVVLLKEMLLCGYKPDVEPFLSMMLQTFRGLKMFDLRTRARIFVPHGRSMMGCLDETRTLDYGEVFVQFSPANHEANNLICQGKVVVAKNPCLYPGDIRVLKAVNVPALHHLVDCVVFPQKGLRPHPNECSGSDLDGDIYFVSWDPELIPPRQIPPMDYSPAPTVVLNHDVRIEEVQEYFTNYIVNDSLGVIANAHTAFADKEPQMAESPPCVELAKLFSIAVDFPKTGVPAVIPADLHVKEYPDFMEKLGKQTYESHRVLGKLFREVKDIAPQASCIKSFTRDVAVRSYDPDMEVDGFENYLDDAQYYKGEYDFKLGNLMDYYEIKTEAEILCGSIMKLKKSFGGRKDVEAIGMAVRSLQREARSWFDEKSATSGTQEDDVFAKASAWYHVTYHQDYWGCYNEGMKRSHFLSFPWCVYDKLIQIKRVNSASNA